ncbi:hypothetical protein [Streptomyces sp. NPDC058657]|uniref:hypothetical protein n=1 Tax=unclassified Streptomyces TaxID=2593676 RepID=UPI0036478A20
MPDISVRSYRPRPHLGRHLVLDPRSLAYCPAFDGLPWHVTAWEPRIPVLDQRHLIGQGISTRLSYGTDTDLDALASCTGNAATALMSILLTRTQAKAAGMDLACPSAAQHYAIGLYADATERDAWHDATWPSQDCGSSGLAVTQVLHQRGLITHYEHATSAEELCTLLQHGPVLMGLPWHSTFSSPGPDGFIDTDPTWAASPLEGGHEVCVTALERMTTTLSGTLDPEYTVIRFRNSWGLSYGDHGDGRMYLSTYLALRDQIDIVQPLIGARP